MIRVGIDARQVARGLGASTFVMRLTEELLRLGDFRIVWYGEPALAPAGVERCIALKRLPYPLLDSRAFRRLARAHGVDVFHFTANSGWRSRGEPPFVLTLLDVLFFGRTPGRSFRQVVGHTYQRKTIQRSVFHAAAVATLSHAAAGEAEQKLRFPAPPRVIPLGVDVEGAAGRTGSSDYVVAFAGRDPRKRIDLVAEALRQADDLGLRLVALAGAGVPEGFQETYAAELASGRFTLAGYLPRAEVRRCMAGALALVYPSVGEGFGLPVLEGLALGTPVITGLAPATREVGGDAVLVIDQGKPAASIAAYLRQLHRGPALADQLRAAGLRRASTFTWRTTAERYAAVYLEAVETRT